MTGTAGPLAGIKVLEVGGIGPLPFVGTMLADMGAEVIKIERPQEIASAVVAGRPGVFRRGRKAIALDLKSDEGKEVLFKLISTADVLLEGFRPGVMEKLGLGPEDCAKVRPELVYGRVTGWGRQGPLAMAAGHDLNYIAITGALHAIGTTTSGPVPPINLVGDYAGGAMFLAFGVVCALQERQRSGLGQVVDAAMVDGAAFMMANVFARWQSGGWADERGTNTYDSGAYFYNVYQTADDRYVSVAPVEPQFRKILCDCLGIDVASLPKDSDHAEWEKWKSTFADLFRTKTRDQWVELLEGTDACFAPVLSLGEVFDHPHIAARGTFAENDGVVQPTPTPRFSRSGTRALSSSPTPGQDTLELLEELGLSRAEIDELLERGVVGAPQTV